MRAAVQHEAGGPEVLVLSDVPDPVPGAADVVVDVAATALNRLDVVQRSGTFQLPGFSYPHIAGMDIAGTVSELGTRVSDWAVGDRVIVDPSLTGVSDDSSLAGSDDLYGEHGILGATRDGGYAQRCLVPASHCLAIPDHVNFEEAAAIPTCWVAASHALYPIGGLSAGESVMIHAAASGVSVAAIQLARDTGATVLATAETDDKCALALEIGAHQVANNQTDDIAAWATEVTDGAGVDMVFDHVGAALFGPSLGSLAIGGRLVTAGNTSGDRAMIPSLGHLFHSQIRILGSGPYLPGELAEVWSRFCGGGFRAMVDSEFELADAAAAHAKMEADDFFGKILLRP